jgi:hypothetical protein
MEMESPAAGTEKRAFPEICSFSQGKAARAAGAFSPLTVKKL